MKSILVNVNNEIHNINIDNVTYTPSKGDYVIVSVDDVLHYGVVICGKIGEEESNNNLIRKCSLEDMDKINKNLGREKEAIVKINELIIKYTLDMKVVFSRFSFDNKQLLFQFTSDNRVDFRNLVKDLALIYKLRIELKQIGVRDRSKLIGGIGQCGRELCCKAFLNEFTSVYINMAKTQNIALNPNKINGMCGRLLCCLNYEDEQYKEYRKDLPKIGDKLVINEKPCRVISLDVYKKTYTVEYLDKIKETIKV